MAEQIVSPGVFTNEVDQSFLPGGIAQIGAAIVGPTVKGPALIPTKVTSFGEFQQIFGGYTDESYVPFAVDEYLKNGNSITVTRLLYEDGYKLSNGSLAVVATSASVAAVTHVLHPTRAVFGSGSSETGNYFESSLINNDESGSFEIKVSGSFVAGTDSAIGFNGSFLAGNGASVSASIDSSKNDYIVKVFGKSAKSVDYPVYVQYENKTASSLFNNLGDVTVSLVKLSNYELLQDYQTAATPWITSQKIGSTAKNLFKVHTLAHGTSVNHEVKVGIRDIKTSSEVSDPLGYPTFTVEVRRVNTANIVNSPYNSNDTDSAPEIIEVFQDVNLNPESSRFISRVIGDRYMSVTADNELRVNGDYPNKSKYIRIEVTEAVTNGANESSLFPFGFRAVNSPIPAAGANNLTAVSYRTTQIDTTYSGKLFHGFDYTNVNNLNYLAPVPTSGSTTGSNSDFYLGDVSQASEAAFPSLSAPYSGSLTDAISNSEFETKVSIVTRKFMVPMQGGFDGAKPNLKKYSGKYIAPSNTFGFDCSGTSTTGTVAYNKALSILSNTDYYDMNMLITPGILLSEHPIVAAAARNLVETRQDAFYVMDSNALEDNITTVVGDVTGIDSNYTATYWPWVRVIEPSKNIPTWVPPSVVVPGALAFSDAVSAPWYAPAGLNRGGLTSVSDTYQNLSQANRNTLYSSRVNPIANFPNEGIVIWGQKTLQARPSALDRVNVRRLLIAVKKYIASTTKYLVFEQNTSVTRNKFLSTVNPYLESVKQAQGLSAFKVVMDSTNNTPDLVDRNILYGQIFLQPTRTAEFIIIDFNIQPTGAAFPE